MVGLMILPRDHTYVAFCNVDHCYVQRYERKPFAAQRDGSRHARRNPGHTVYLWDMTDLTSVTRWHFDAIPTMDAPPF